MSHFRHISDGKQCTGDWSDTQAERVQPDVLVPALQLCTLYVKLMCAPKELAGRSSWQCPSSIGYDARGDIRHNNRLACTHMVLARAEGSTWQHHHQSCLLSCYQMQHQDF